MLKGYKRGIQFTQSPVLKFTVLFRSCSRVSVILVAEVDQFGCSGGAGGWGV